MKAEATIYTNDISGAATIINAGTRITRGQMMPVTATLANLIGAIHQERLVEMIFTGCGLNFYEK